MNVNEIYNLIKNAVCLPCRKDKGILDVMKQPAIVTVNWEKAEYKQRCS